MKLIVLLHSNSNDRHSVIFLFLQVNLTSHVLMKLALSLLDINNENNISIKKGDTIQVFGQDVIVYNYSENTGEVTYIVLDTVKFNEALKKYKNKPKTRVILP